MVDARRPIGVFDSGIGGLTVFKALSRRMPEENILYFADMAHVPYGSKSRRAVTRYSLQVARFLSLRRIKALVIACNTSSALALSAVRRAVPIPVIGVIGPGARAAAKATRCGDVGIIATEATIASGSYTQALRRLMPRVHVAARACPLFVPLVEEGWWTGAVTARVARHYLKGIKGSKTDTLILGCTHYPLLKKTLRAALGPAVQLIDSAEETARETEELLSRLKLRRKAGRGKPKFFVSDAPRRFLRLARLLGVKIERVSLHPFDA